MKKKLVVAFLALCMVLSMTACGGGKTSSGGSDDNTLRTAASFAYPSLDVHKEYYGWYTSIYGISEALFKFDVNAEVVPCLAESAEVDGNVWTIKLKDGAAFSNGDPLTADMVIKNIERFQNLKMNG